MAMLNNQRVIVIHSRTHRFCGCKEWGSQMVPVISNLCHYVWFNVYCQPYHRHIKWRITWFQKGNVMLYSVDDPQLIYMINWLYIITTGIISPIIYNYKLIYIYIYNYICIYITLLFNYIYIYIVLHYTISTVPIWKRCGGPGLCWVYATWDTRNGTGNGWSMGLKVWTNSRLDHLVIKRDGKINHLWLLVTGTMELLWLSILIGNGKSSQLTFAYFSVGLVNHQPDHYYD